MRRFWMNLAVLAVFVALTSGPAAAQDSFSTVSSETGALRLMTTAPMEAVLGGGMDLSSCPTCPRLYDNTDICTVSVQALPVGGRTSATSSPLSVRDWFVTGGGSVSGFDLFLLNSGDVDTHVDITFWEGTDEQGFGQNIAGAQFRTAGGPALMRLPVYTAPDGTPRLIRFSVDYDAQTYNLVGLYEENGVLVEEQLNPVDQPIGTNFGRASFSLPKGKVGVQVRLTQIANICEDGDPSPQAGVALASGGNGTADGVHIINAATENCSSAEYPQLCENDGWAPLGNTGVFCDLDSECVDAFGIGADCIAPDPKNAPENQLCFISQPCTGGNVCSLDRPFFGTALTLYIGANSDELSDSDGNNEILTADTLVTPAVGNGATTSIAGYLGDNGTPIGAGTPFPLFDVDEDGDVDLIDWRDYQRCFGRDDADCLVHDGDTNGVDLDDYDAFFDCFTDRLGTPNFTPNDPVLCMGEVPPPPVQLQDLDLYRIGGVAANEVVSILVEGTRDSLGDSKWDPYLRVFDANGNQIPFANGVGGISDDYEPSSLDAFTTVEVPAGANALYVGISASEQIIKFQAPSCVTGEDCVNEGFAGTCSGGDNDGEVCNSNFECADPMDTCAGGGFCPCESPCDGNGLCDISCSSDEECQSVFGPDGKCGTSGDCDLVIWYDPSDPETIRTLTDGRDAGAYTLSVWRTDPNSVSDPGGNQFACREFQHEPDDTIDQADDRGAAPSTIIFGAIGDGAFAHIGQDMDLYLLDFSGGNFPTTTRSLSASIRGLAGGGFQTTFDLVLALYTSDGELIATGDQSQELGALDQTRPKFNANICGSTAMNCENPSLDPGKYYLAVFATDRQQFEEDGDTLRTAIPPTLLNFPHGTRVAATNDSDLRPFVGGRVNKPGPPIVGRTPPNPNVFPNSDTLQCYRLNISTSSQPLSITGSADVDEIAGPDGNDSIPDAAGSVVPGDSLASSMPTTRVLGNGHYGGFQGDVDFYSVSASPGQIVSMNVADATPSGNTNNFVRSYLALYDADGFIFAEHDYSLERHDTNIFITDSISDEIAANVASVVPQFTGAGNPMGAVYAMVGIDNGNMEVAENTPFDAAFPGTTLSRRFETNVSIARNYNIAITRLTPQADSMDDRVFAVARRGIDAIHTEPFLDDPADATPASYPPILELDPATGEVTKILEVQQSFFSMFRVPLNTCISVPDAVCPAVVSSNPLIAYDGTTLWVTAERCNSGPGGACQTVTNPLFKVNPDLSIGQSGFVTPFGSIAGLNGDVELTGMVEIGGYLYALNTVDDTLRFWDKLGFPSASGGLSVALTTLSGTDKDETDFDDVDGDIATDGTNIFVACSNNGASIGICQFGVELAGDGLSVTLTFAGTIDDPITQEGLIPGPRLGGITILEDGRLMATDSNGPIVEYLDLGTDAVQAVKLPTEFVVERLTSKLDAGN